MRADAETQSPHTLFIWRLHSHIKHDVFFLPPPCHGCTTNVISFSVKRCIAGLCNKPFFPCMANLTWLHLLLVLNPSKQALQNAEGTSMQLNTSASFITALKGHFFMSVLPHASSGSNRTPYWCHRSEGEGIGCLHDQNEFLRGCLAKERPDLDLCEATRRGHYYCWHLHTFICGFYACDCDRHLKSVQDRWNDNEDDDRHYNGC